MSFERLTFLLRLRLGFSGINAPNSSKSCSSDSTFFFVGLCTRGDLFTPAAANMLIFNFCMLLLLYTKFFLKMVAFKYNNDIRYCCYVHLISLCQKRYIQGTIATWHVWPPYRAQSGPPLFLKKWKSVYLHTIVVGFFTKKI